MYIDTPYAMWYSCIQQKQYCLEQAMSVLEEKGSRQGITERFTHRAYNDIAITYYIPSDYVLWDYSKSGLISWTLILQAGTGRWMTRLTSGYRSTPCNDSNSFHRFRYPNEYKKV